MVIEHAEFQVKEGMSEKFIEAVYQAQDYLKEAHGYISHQLLINHESNNLFLLEVKWNRLEDHIEVFINSEGIQKWNSKITPFLDSEVKVLHYFEI